MKQVTFGVFKIYNSENQDIGLASGELERIKQLWSQRGGIRFEPLSYKLIDEPVGTVVNYIDLNNDCLQSKDG
jgi:hypothetical protein